MPTAPVSADGTPLETQILLPLTPLSTNEWQSTSNPRSPVSAMLALIKQRRRRDGRVNIASDSGSVVATSDPLDILSRPRSLLDKTSSLVDIPSSPPLIEHLGNLDQKDRLNTDQSVDNNVFHLFPNLPIELRTKIWELSLPEPRIFTHNTVYMLMNCPARYYNSYRIPLLLQVSAESAFVFQKNHFECCSFKGTNPKLWRKIYFKPKHDIYIIRLLDLENKHSNMESSLVRELVVNLTSCSPRQLLKLETSWFDLFENLETIIFMSSRYNRSIRKCNACNVSGMKVTVGCHECVDRERCLPAMEHALAVSRRIQNVVVKNVDEKICHYPYLTVLEEHPTVWPRYCATRGRSHTEDGR